MVVVSDTSIISNLIQLERVRLLHELFGEIIIPQSVYNELSVIQSHSEFLDKTKWVNVKTVKKSPLYEELLKKLDSGEAESIVLSIELKADLLLVDEKRGRRIASSYGVKISGLIGVLIKAKEQSLIKSIKPLLDKLIYEVGFRINPKLYSEILEITNEE